MDSQTVEIVGRNWLVNRLVEDGLEVARPERDRGVDLIAYLDLAASDERFVARPIQMKAATVARFGLDRKFERIANLLLVFVWLRESTAYALTWQEAMRVGDAMGYTATPVWLARGRYDTTAPSQRLRGHLEPFRMGAGDWHRRVAEVA